jgi:hypothetical protein
MLGVLLFLLSALLLAMIAARRVLRGQLSSIVFAALAGYATLAAMTANSTIAEFGPEAYLHGAGIYAVGSIVLSFTVTLLTIALPSAGQGLKLWTDQDLARHAQICLVLALFGLVTLGFSRDDLLATWSEARSEAGLATTLGTFLLLIASPGVVSAFFARRRFLAPTLLMLCGVGFVVSGSRATILAAVALAFWLLLSRADSGRSKLKIIVVAVIIAVFAHVLLRQLRGLGIGGLIEAYQGGSFIEALLDFEGESDLSGGEAAIPRYFFFSTLVSSSHEFGFMTSIVRLALLAVPRVEGWFDKPVDVTYLLWERGFVDGLFADAPGHQALLESFVTGSLGSLHATLFGEYFLTGGWVSLVLSVVVLGMLLVGIDAFLRKADRLTALALCGPMVVGYLFVARGNSVIGIGYFFYLGILFTLTRRLFDPWIWRNLLMGNRMLAVRLLSSSQVRRP